MRNKRLPLKRFYKDFKLISDKKDTNVAICWVVLYINIYFWNSGINDPMKHVVI